MRMPKYNDLSDIFVVAARAPMRCKPLDIALGARALDDGGDESRLEVDYSLGSLSEAQDQVLDEIGDAAVGDDEEPRDGSGNALGQVVAFPGPVLALLCARVAGRRAG